MLARLVRHAHAYDDPGADSPVQEVTSHEDLIGEPILPMTIGVPDREVARHSILPAPPGAMAQARVTAGRELSALGHQRIAFQEDSRARPEEVEVLKPSVGGFIDVPRTWFERHYCALTTRTAARSSST